MFTSIRTKNQQGAKRPGSNIALAIALLAGTALSVGVIADPAHARKRDREEDKAPKADYSKEFLAAYGPLNTMTQGEAPNFEGVKQQIPALISAIKTADDKNVAGGLIFNTGRNVGDTAMQVQGLDMMLDSGTNDSKKSGQLQFTKYQILRDVDNYAGARAALQGAIDENYSFNGTLSDGTAKQFLTNDLKVMMSELYFSEEDYSGGLQYLQGLIDETTAKGEKPEENWIRRGFSVAYENGLVEESMALSIQNVEFYPSAISWGNALAVQRNSFDNDDSVTLDLMRLVDRTGAMKNGRDYVDYLDAADARRLPGEALRIVNAGVSSGALENNDVYVREVKEMATGRIASDKADIPSLEADARKANSTAVTATAAGDVFLSYGMAAKAEEMYTIAASKTGVDLPRVLTRLGITQVDQGKSNEAMATFAKIGGTRAGVAKLWSLYAKSKAVPAPAPAMEPEVADETAAM